MNDKHLIEVLTKIIEILDKQNENMRLLMWRVKALEKRK